MEQSDYQKLDVLFVIPPVLRFLGKSSAFYPLGLGYMTSYLKRHGFTAQIYNADIYRPPNVASLSVRAFKFIIRKLFGQVSFNVDYSRKWVRFYKQFPDMNNPIWEEIRNVLKTLSPKIVAIGSKAVDIPSTLVLAGIVKEVLPDVTVVIGGPSATTCAEILMANNAVDYLVNGEGEETMLELTARILQSPGKKSTSDILGIVYRNNIGKAVSTPSRPLIRDIDGIPFPDRDAMFSVNSEGKMQPLQECTDVLSSRGCPYPCRFCCAYQAWGTKKPRFRSIQNIIDELIFLKGSYNQKKFIFWDDLFTIKRERTIELCRKITHEKLNIEWISLVRIDLVDAELLQTMKQAGCYEIQIGIESGSDRVLRYIKKGITIEIIRKQAQIIAKSGLPWRIFLIIGFPTETREEIQNTMNLISELQPTYVDLSIFCPYPGTDLYDEMKEADLLNPDFMKSDMWYPYNNYTNTMSDREFTKIALKALTYVDRYNTKEELGYFAPK